VNYIAEINAFNQMMRRHPLSESAQLLWYKLMDFDNRLYWPETFSIDNARLAGLICSSENTAKTARDQLVKAGLLEFIRGQKGRPSSYRLIPPSTLALSQEEHEKPPPEGVEGYYDTDDITTYFGWTEALGAELDKITDDIIGRFWPERKPDENDRRRIFHYIREQHSTEDGQTIMTFPEDRKALLAYAFEQSSMAGKHSWQYIEGCFGNFAKRGIRNLDAAYEYEERRAAARR
jgi:hypothetical protein